jgi:hypothetical protein
MEIVDLLDNSPSKLAAILYFLPPYIGAGLNGQPSPLSYTEEVVGSSPVPSIKEPLGVEVFAIMKAKHEG